MNEIIKAMKERRSIHKFKSELPSKADLEQMVEAGLYATNGMGKQATKIIVVTNKELRDKISEMNRKIGDWDDDNPDKTVLLIDQWENQEAIDVHHASPIMKDIMSLCEKYDLHMTVERFLSDESGVPEIDKKFIFCSIFYQNAFH